MMVVMILMMMMMTMIAMKMTQLDQCQVPTISKLAQEKNAT